ncbi:MAG TPA: helix-turn-helix domain-containing protein, partial [Archangium sp.]|nr:helix-turn-helix domain-containing protein [Archangium sp.]
KHRLSPPRINPSALARLCAYRFPGNVRELENCIESAVVLCEGEILEEHLPLPKVVSAAPAPAESVETVVEGGTGELLPLAEVEKRHILRVLDSVKGNRTAASKVLQIGRNTLGRKLKEYGIADEG